MAFESASPQLAHGLQCGLAPGIDHGDPQPRLGSFLGGQGALGVPGPADLYRQGLAEFFLDDLFEYRAGMAVLRPEVQRRLLPMLRDNGRASALHTPLYSMLAYPWAQQYQQSNQWAIETLALLAEPAVGSRRQARAWLRAFDYRPATLYVSTLKRLGARIGTAHIAFDDHPHAAGADRVATTDQPARRHLIGTRTSPTVRLECSKSILSQA
mgnify:CR=1 FL=1